MNLRLLGPKPSELCPSRNLSRQAGSQLQKLKPQNMEGCKYVGICWPDNPLRRFADDADIQVSAAGYRGRHATRTGQTDPISQVENEVLRSKLPARITVTPKERQRLLKYGAKLGRAIRQLVTIVAPNTFLRWIREAKESRRADRAPARGRRRTPEQLRRLILKLARENNWGYKRIVDELKKLGIRRISVSNVRNISKPLASIPVPSGRRRPGTSFCRNMPPASGSATSSVKGC